MKSAKQALLAFLLLLVLGYIGQAQDAPELRLLAYNLHNERELLDPMVAVIREADADVVGLAETTIEAFARFEQEFAGDYPYRTANPRTDVAMLSKYEIVEQQFYPPEKIHLLRTVLDVDGLRVTVFVVHPTSPGNTNYDFDPRGEEIAFLMEQVALETQPVILLGDFNTEEWSQDYDAIAATLIDSYRDLYPDTAGPTYPDYSTPQSRVHARLPRWTPLILRIDYVFHDPAFTTLEAQVWPNSGGSDHRPLFVRLGLPLETLP
jgi:vancomycin resistance protein VanJ